MNEFVLIMVVFPLSIITGSVIVTMALRRLSIAPTITLVTFLYLAYIAFNASFLVWTFIYTILSTIIAAITQGIHEKGRHKRRIEGL